MVPLSSPGWDEPAQWIAAHDTSVLGTVSELLYPSVIPRNTSRNTWTKVLGEAITSVGQLF